MLRSALKSIIRRTPYRVVWARDANRFQAIEECLTSLARRGLEPRRIVDGGANVGAFARQAASIFTTATIDLVEPQPGCRDALVRLAQDKRFRFHAVALGAEDANVYLTVDPAGVTTGAHNFQGDAPSDLSSVLVPVARLDTLLGSQIRNEDRTLLKLDLQGWELEALKGGKHARQDRGHSD